MHEATLNVSNRIFVRKVSKYNYYTIGKETIYYSLSGLKLASQGLLLAYYLLKKRASLYGLTSNNSLTETCLYRSTSTGMPL